MNLTDRLEFNPQEYDRKKLARILEQGFRAQQAIGRFGYDITGAEVVELVGGMQTASTLEIGTQNVQGETVTLIRDTYQPPAVAKDAEKLNTRQIPSSTIIGTFDAVHPAQLLLPTTFMDTFWTVQDFNTASERRYEKSWRFPMERELDETRAALEDQIRERLGIDTTEEIISWHGSNVRVKLKDGRVLTTDTGLNLERTGFAAMTEYEAGPIMYASLLIAKLLDQSSFKMNPGDYFFASVQEGDRPFLPFAIKKSYVPEKIDVVVDTLNLYELLKPVLGLKELKDATQLSYAYYYHKALEEDMGNQGIDMSTIRQLSRVHVDMVNFRHSISGYHHSGKG